MANKKISELSTSTSYNAATTFVPVVDTNDTSESPSGSNYKVSLDQLVNDTEVPSNFVFVKQKSDLPTASSGVITLDTNTTYFLVADVDLTGDRIVASEGTTLIGTSSETAKLTSTGLASGVALFTSEWTVQLRQLTIRDVGTAISINGATNSASFDWTGLNFENVTTIGTATDVSNFIYVNGAFLSSQGLTFEGSIGTISFSNSLFVGDGSASSIIELGSTLSISRRFRVIYSSFVAFSSTVGITVDAGASTPSEGFILEQINFSGGGTYLSGINNEDPDARIIECRGVDNTAILGGCFFTGNSDVTTIISINTPVQIQGSSSEYDANQQFTHTSPITLRYDGALTRSFKIEAVLSCRGVSIGNLQCTLYMGLNGSVVTQSAVGGRTASSSEAINMSFQYITELSTNDEITMFIENNDNGDDFVVEGISFIATKV